MPTKELDLALVGSTTSWGRGLTWEAKSDFIFRLFTATDRSLGVKQGTCHEGWRQKGSTQLDSVQGLETFLGGAVLSGGDEVRRTGLTAHRRERSKSESIMCPSSRMRMFSGFRSR